MNKSIIPLLMLFIILISVGCTTIPLPLLEGEDQILSYADEFLSIPLNLTEEPVITKNLQSYFDYYSLNFPGVKHYYGMISSAGYSIATHVYKPETSRGTIYFLHGYLLHSTSYPLFFEYIIEKGYTIVAFDLPGHGFSSGSRGAINSFSEYLQVFLDVIKNTRASVPEPFAAIGISTGGAILTEYLVDGGNDFKCYCMASPLIRSTTWDLSRIGFCLFGWCFKSLSGVIPDATSNKEAFDFIIKHDPIRLNAVTTLWLKALFSWYDNLCKKKPLSTQPVLMIQGERDFVLEWKYNIAFLQKLIPGITVYRMKQAKHEILFETADIRNEAFDVMYRFIEDPVSLNPPVN